jgi:HlyD family secretion protein
VIDVHNPELKLRPGMTANVTVVHADRQDALRVPNAALRFRPPPEMLAALGRTSGAPGRVAGRDGGRGAPQAAAGGGSGRSLWVLRDGRPVPAQVTVGVSDGTFTEILSGPVEVGDPVVTGVESTGRPPTPAAPPGGPVRRPF